VGYAKLSSALAWKAFIFAPFPLHSLSYPVFSQSNGSEIALNTSTSTSSQPSPLSLEGETLIFIPHISVIMVPDHEFTFFTGGLIEGAE
jgi:hypothetical protein